MIPQLSGIEVKVGEHTKKTFLREVEALCKINGVNITALSIAVKKDGHRYTATTECEVKTFQRKICMKTKGASVFRAVKKALVKLKDEIFGQDSLHLKRVSDNLDTDRLRELVEFMRSSKKTEVTPTPEKEVWVTQQGIDAESYLDWLETEQDNDYYNQLAKEYQDWEDTSVTERGGTKDQCSVADNKPALAA